MESLESYMLKPGVSLNTAKQTEVADKMGIHVSTLSRLTNRRSSYKKSMAYMFAMIQEGKYNEEVIKKYFERIK